MVTVAEYIGKLPQPQRGIVSSLRRSIRDAAPDANESIKWGKPCYMHNGLLCSIMPCKAHVNLVLFKGARLDDPDGLVEGTGKSVRHIKIRMASDIKLRAFTRLLKQAVVLSAARRSGSTSSKRQRG